MKAKFMKILPYATIITLQIIVVLYWAGVKTNYHIDELYSMTHASGFTGQVYNSEYITTSRDFHFNEWTNNSILKKYLTVSDDEKAFNAPLSKVIGGIIKYRNYYGFLNVAESVFGYSDVSPIPGLFLNIVFFVITELLLILFLNKLGIDAHVKCLAIVHFGFSGYILSTVEYIRFYMLVIMLLMLMLNCFYGFWKADTWKQVFLCELGVLVAGYFSIQDSELTFFFLGGAIASLFIAIIMFRKLKQLISLIVLGIVGIVYLIYSTDYIGAVLNPAKYAAGSAVMKNASAAIHETSIGTVKSYLGWLKSVFDTLFWGHHLIPLLLIATVTIGIIIKTNIVGSGERQNGLDLKKIRPVTAIAFLVWVGIYAISIMLGSGRLLCEIVLYSIVVFAFAEAMGYKLGSFELSLSHESVFMIVVAGAALIYTSLCALCQFTVWRYYCFGFVSCFILFWYVMDRLLKRDGVRSINSLLIKIMTIFVVLISLLPFMSRKIENMYEDDKAFIEKIDSHADLDVILMLAYDEGEISRHETYDCIQIMPESTNIYISDISDYEYSRMDIPNNFILWTHEGRDISEFIYDLKAHGYIIEDLGKDHCSKAYFCRL